MQGETPGGCGARNGQLRRYRLVSFMRGVVESAIKNMSPEERDQALNAVMQQVVSSMSTEERKAALVDIVTLLSGDLSAEDRVGIIRSIEG